MRYILPVILFVYFSPVFAHAVDEPCSVKSFVTIPRQGFSEFGNDSLQTREFVSQDSVNHHFFGGPVGGNWIEPFQFGENPAPESGCGLVKSGFSVDSIRNISTKNSSQKTSNNFVKVVDKKIDHLSGSDFDWLWRFVVLPIYLMPLWITWIFPGIYSVVLLC